MTVTSGEAREWSESMRLIGGGLVRQVLLAHQMGVPAALGMSLAEWRQEYMGGTIQLPREERRAVVAELTTPVDEGGPGMSTREVADVLGVSHPTVVRDGSNEPKRKRRRSAPQHEGGTNEPDSDASESADLIAPRGQHELVGKRIWEKMLELSECRVELEVAQVELGEAIGTMPADQLEGVEQVAAALIGWLADVRREAQVGQGRHPVKLGEQRIKRGKDGYGTYPNSS